jgi:hypothetical protein
LVAVIRLAFILVIVAGAFLGGYYFGHQPGSPDIFALADQLYRDATHAGSALKATDAAPQPRADAAKQDAVKGKMAVCIDGRTYLVGADRD